MVRVTCQNTSALIRKNIRFICSHIFPVDTHWSKSIVLKLQIVSLSCSALGSSSTLSIWVALRGVSYLIYYLYWRHADYWHDRQALVAAAMTHANCTKAFVEKAGHSKMFLPVHVCTKQPVGWNVAKICKTQPFERRTTLMWKFLQILRVI